MGREWPYDRIVGEGQEKKLGALTRSIEDEFNEEEDRLQFRRLGELALINSIVLQSKPPMRPSPPELSLREPHERRIRYYQKRVERLLRRHGIDFVRFTTGYQQLVTFGEEKLRAFETTGYNILHNTIAMPMASRRLLLFYGNYIARTRHFGLLLATMEQEGIITPDQVRFGVRATKVLYKPEWVYDPTIAELSIIERINPQGEVSEHGVLQSVETVVTFSPGTDTGRAVAIAYFLKQRAKHGEIGAIADSNVDPDIRATAALRGVLPESDFPAVIANIRSIGQAQIVILRKETGFVHPWRAIPLAANEDLVNYLGKEGVSP